jgi:hypothetical protein
VVLEGPDAVVADDPDDGQVVAGHGVEFHAAEAEGAAAQEEADLAIGLGLGAPSLGSSPLGQPRSIRAPIHVRPPFRERGEIRL